MGQYNKKILGVNTYASNTGAPKYMGRDFNTPLTSISRSSRQKINEETQALNGTLGKMDLDK